MELCRWRCRHHSASAHFQDESESKKPTVFSSFDSETNATLNQILELIMQNFILSWHQQLNVSNNRQFERFVRSAFVSATESFFARIRRQLSLGSDFVILLIFGLSNTLIVHLVRLQTIQFSFDDLA